MLNVFYRVAMGREFLNTYRLLFVFGLLFFLQFSLADTLPGECGTGKKLLLYKTDRSIDSLVNSRFSEDFFDGLNDPLKEIGYCPEFFDKLTSRDSTALETPVLYTTVKIDSINGAILIVSLEKANSFISRDYSGISSQPLISLSIDSSEISTFIAVAVRKTIENLRTQYICHLRLQSNPPGVFIRSNNGLEGVTPLEWVIPVGELKISGKIEKHLPLVRTLDLRDPGIHTYVLDLQRKQFYSSKFMYPTVGFGLASAVFYTYERYYYSKYLNLGREEYFNAPEKFEKTFNTAKKFEYATITSLALTAVSFSLCFFF